MGQLYPEITPYKHGFLKVDGIHEIYYEACGNPNGKNIVFLHGGPGGGVNENHRRYFNPEEYNIILFDQRGCGKSRPFAELTNNTTWDLVSDIEKIREFLGIKSWSVFGGSWGSTLALAYAQKHPKVCEALFLRGIFMLRQKELHWFYQEGANMIYPDAWEPYENAIPKEERNNYIVAYYKRLTGDNLEERKKAATAWSTWEGSTSKLIQESDFISHFGEDEFADAFARIECHYFINKGFFDSDEYLLENIDKIKHIPAIIVQGRYDVVCPMMSAWELHKKWPEAKFQVIQDAGHSLTESGITKALISALDSFAKTGALNA